MTALFALFLAVASIPAAVPLEPVAVIATAYSCDAPSPMYPCGTTRWGNDPLTDGMACPPEWARMAFIVPTQGLLTCDDSGRYDKLTTGGVELLHIDIRMGSHEEAIEWGIRKIVIYKIRPQEKGQMPKCLPNENSKCTSVFAVAQRLCVSIPITSTALSNAGSWKKF